MQTVCECIVILRGIREVSWKSAKGMMSEANFLAALKKMDVDGITSKQTAATKSRFFVTDKTKLNKIFFQLKNQCFFLFLHENKC